MEWSSFCGTSDVEISFNLRNYICTVVILTGWMSMVCLLGGVYLHDWTFVNITDNAFGIEKIGFSPNTICFFANAKFHGNHSASLVLRDVADHEPLLTMYFPVLAEINRHGHCSHNISAFYRLHSNATFTASQLQERELWHMINKSPESACLNPAQTLGRLIKIDMAKRSCASLNNLSSIGLVAGIIAIGLQCFLVFLTCCTESQMSHISSSNITQLAKLLGLVALIGTSLGLIGWFYYSYSYIRVPGTVKSFGAGMRCVFLSLFPMFLSVRATWKIGGFRDELVENDEIWKFRRPLDYPPSYAI